MAKKSAAPVETEKSQNPYEAMFLLPAAAASDVDGSIKTVQGIVERHGGKIIVSRSGTSAS